MSTQSMQLADAAQLLHDAQRSSIPISPLTQTYPNLDVARAYSVQRLNLADHNSDDNPDDRRTPNNAHNCPSRAVFCLVTRCAWSWQCGSQGCESP